MLELWDYLVQFLVTACGFCAALREYYRARRQPWFLLTCFYATFALGTLYWSLHLLLRQETPPVVCLPQFILYVTYGDVLSNVFMCGMTMLLAWCAVRGLVWAKRSGGARLRRFYGTVLAFAALEYALWTSSCFWVSDTLTNPYFWFDFLLSLVLLLLLPALRKAVDA